MRRKVSSSKAINYGLGLAVNTVRRVRDMLNAAFNFAVDERLISHNPVRRTRLPPPPVSSANPLTIEEAFAFIKVRECSWYGDALVFDLQTGLRPEELMSLIWDDVDFQAGTLRVERACKWAGGTFRGFGTPKSQLSNRVIELAPEHIEFLKERKERLELHTEEKKKAGRWAGEPKIKEWLSEERPNQTHLYRNTNLIFPSRRGNVPHIIAPRKSFRFMLRRAGFTDSRLKVRWYDLRHTHATFLLILGVPPHEVAARMGHTVDTLNTTYAHILPERQRMASSIFVKLFPFKIFDNLNMEEFKKHIQEFVRRSKRDLEDTLINLLGRK